MQFLTLPLWVQAPHWGMEEVLQGGNVLSEIWIKKRNIYGQQRKSEERNGYMRPSSQGLPSPRSTALRRPCRPQILHKLPTPPLCGGPHPTLTTGDVAFDCFYVCARFEPVFSPPRSYLPAAFTQSHTHVNMGPLASPGLPMGPHPGFWQVLPRAPFLNAPPTRRFCGICHRFKAWMWETTR